MTKKETKKKCAKCGRNRLVENFPKDNSAKDKLWRFCRYCEYLRKHQVNPMTEKQWLESKIKKPKAKKVKKPKSKVKSLSDSCTKSVSETCERPSALVLKKRGLSYPLSSFHDAISSGVTCLAPSCALAISSGLLTIKNNIKVIRFTPISMGMA